MSNITDISEYIDELEQMLKQGVETTQVRYLFSNHESVSVIGLIDYLLGIQAQGYNRVMFSVTTGSHGDLIVISPVIETRHKEYKVNMSEINLN